MPMCADKTLNTLSLDNIVARCWEIQGCATNEGATVNCVYGCKPLAAACAAGSCCNGAWSLNSNGTITSVMYVRVSISSIYNEFCTVLCRHLAVCLTRNPEPRAATRHRCGLSLALEARAPLFMLTCAVLMMTSRFARYGRVDGQTCSVHTCSHVV